MKRQQKSVLDTIDQVQRLLTSHFQSDNAACSMCAMMNALPDVVSGDDVDPFLTVCCRRHFCDPAVLVAVYHNKVDLVQDLLPDAQSKFLGDLAIYLATRRLNPWASVKQIILSHPKILPVKLLRKLSYQALDDEALDLFQILVGRCTEFSKHLCLLVMVLDNAISKGLVRQFKLLIYSKNEIIHLALHSKIWDQIPFRLLRNVSISRLSPSYMFSSADYIGCLAVVCEAGLLTGSFARMRAPAEFTNVISMAALLNQPDLVRVLYAVGAATNGELRDISLSHHLESMCIADHSQRGMLGHVPPEQPSVDLFDVDNVKEVREFLADAATQPRPLQSLCILEVSKHIGVGNAKEASLEKLNVPEKIKNMLRFKEIYSLFKKESE